MNDSLDVPREFANNELQANDDSLRNEIDQIQINSQPAQESSNNRLGIGTRLA